MQVLNPIPELNLSGNIPDLVLLADPDEVVTVRLFKGDELIIEELYHPDAKGRITLKFKEIIDDELLVVVPGFSESTFHQETGYADFRIHAYSLYYEEELFFRGIKGEVSTTMLDSSNFLDSNFLTWQPQLKHIQYHDPEWLTYYARGTSQLKVTAYTFPGDVATTRTLAVLPEGQLTTVNLNYGHILSQFSAIGIPQYYDVYVERDGKRRSYVQRYVFSQELIEFNDLFVFANSLGGIDTIRFTGEAIKKDGYTFDKAVFDEQVRDYHQAHQIGYKKDTGYFRTKNERLWSLDFFASMLKFKVHEGALQRIYADDPDLESSQGELSSYTFTYIFSNNTEAMNLSREHQAPPLLHLDGAVDGGKFLMPPMINHYPYATTSDVIIPVQYPFESTWRKLSLSDLLLGVLDPGGDSSPVNLIGGNFGVWTLLPNKNPNVLDQEIPLQFKADRIAFAQRGIVFITGKFRLKPSFRGNQIILGALPEFARPKAPIQKYFITQNIEMFLQLDINGDIRIVSKDEFQLPVDPAGHPFFIEMFFNPDFIALPAPVSFTRKELFTRNNCAPGYYGSEKEFVKIYNAPTLDEAEALAFEDIGYHDEGQAWVNDPANGATCIVMPAVIYTSVRSGSFSRQCQPGYNGSSVVFQKEYTSLISQQDADQKAAADTSNFNMLGQTYANNPVNGAICVLGTYYVWGKIQEENRKTVDGVVYADIMLRAYRGFSETVPPAPVQENEVFCTAMNIMISHMKVLSTGPTQVDFSVNMSNTKSLRLIAALSAIDNPEYPKQVLVSDEGFPAFFAFTGKAKDEMILLQIVI